MISVNIPIGHWFELLITFLKDNLEWLFGAIHAVLGFFINNLERLLTLPPWWLLAVIVAVVMWRRSGIGLAVFSILGLSLIQSMDLWHDTMLTLGLVIVATAIALLISLPLGIWAARNRTVQRIARPTLDFMQTMPAFVYLIPAVTFFSLGTVPGAFSTIIFAMPPAVRLTELGIRQVPREVVEAAISFGATPRQLLYKVQLPIAMPTIMAGVNQTIMLSLSMVVIAAMIGAPGLGRVVFGSIQMMEIGRAFEGGISIVVIAIILDRITQSITNQKKSKK